MVCHRIGSRISRMSYRPTTTDEYRRNCRLVNRSDPTTPWVWTHCPQGLWNLDVWRWLWLNQENWHWTADQRSHGIVCLHLGTLGLYSLLEWSVRRQTQRFPNNFSCWNIDFQWNKCRSGKRAKCSLVRAVLVWGIGNHQHPQRWISAEASKWLWIWDKARGTELWLTTGK